MDHGGRGLSRSVRDSGGIDEDADPSTPVGLAKPLLPELEDLKDYAKRYHHPPGAEVPDDPVEANEVLAYGRRALKIVEAF